MSRVRITVDRLVLRGFQSADAKALARSLQGELEQQFADPVAQARWALPRHTPVLKLGSLRLDSGPAGAARLGAGVARAIGRGVNIGSGVKK